MTQRIRQRVPNRRTGDWESPQVSKLVRRNRGLFSLRRLAERRYWRPETSETGTQQLVRYLEAWYRRHRWTVTASLHCTRCGIVSQIITQHQWKTTLIIERTVATAFVGGITTVMFFASLSFYLFTLILLLTVQRGSVCEMLTCCMLL